MGDSTLTVVNTLGSINFDSISNYECIAKTQILTSNNFFTITSINDIDLETYSGNLGIYADTGIITINSDGNYSNAVIIDASNANGGILQTAGTGGINLITTNGDIDLLSQGSNINIGVSSVGTPAPLQTQNLNLESFNNFNVNSGDMYFISDDVISFVSNTGDIQFGTTSGGAPIIKFENGNVNSTPGLSEIGASPLKVILLLIVFKAPLYTIGKSVFNINSIAKFWLCVYKFECYEKVNFKFFYFLVNWRTMV
jgi:hypothetical protein